MSLLRADARHLPIASGTVQACVTSPPYWGLRDYGTATWDGGEPGCDHQPERRYRVNGCVGCGVPHDQETDGCDNCAARRRMRERHGSPAVAYSEPKRSRGTERDAYVNYASAFRDVCGKCGAKRVDRQLGLESTPDAYVAGMVAVFRQVWRVLKPSGVLFLNLGDSFGPGKQLQGIPWRTALALQADGWYLRSDIIWSKPNPMPESVTDRPTKAHEYVFLLTKASSYYWDAEAVKEPNAEMARPQSEARRQQRMMRTVTSVVGGGQTSKAAAGAPTHVMQASATRNIRSVWSIAAQPTSGLVKNVRQVRVAWDESGDDTTRITSPGCPVHGDLAVQAAKALCGGRGADRFGRIARTDGGHAPAPLFDSVPTDQPHASGSEDGTTDSSGRSHARPAMPRSTESHRTAPAPATSPACTPCAGTSSSTGGTSALPASEGSAGSTHASRTEADCGPDATVIDAAQTAARIAGTERCSCDYCRIESEKTDHFATMPETLAERCILAGSRHGDLVLDPFLGSGTVARCAISLGRRAVGCDLNRDYLRLADERTQVTRGLPFGA